MAISDEWRADVVPNAAGWYAGADVHASYFGPPLRLAADARQYDTSPAWFSWVGAQPSLELLNRIGIPAVYEHDVSLANRFRAGLGMPPSDSAIVSVASDGAAERLERGGHRRRAARRSPAGVVASLQHRCRRRRRARRAVRMTSDGRVTERPPANTGAHDCPRRPWVWGAPDGDRCPSRPQRRPAARARAHARARRAVRRRGARARPASAHEPAGLGPRPHRRLRGSLDRPPPRRRASCCAATSPRSTTPSRRPAPCAATSRSCAARTSSTTSPPCASAALEVLEDAGPGDGTLFELVIRHEAQHNETMRQTLFLARAAGRAAERARRRRGRRGRRGLDPRARRPDRHGRDRRAASPSTTSARATASTCPRTRSRAGR